MSRTPGDDQPRVCFEGELFEVESLRRRLGLPQSASVEVVLGAVLAKQEPASLVALDGVFALAQQNTRASIAYRDPSGLRGLCWGSAADGHPVYATQPVAVGHAICSTPRIARRALHEYLRLLDIAPPHTVVAGVHAVDPGALVTVSTDGAVRQEIPMAPVPSPATSAPNFDAAVDVLDRLLQHSVAVRLAGVPTTAAFLSGGVDSALLCAIAARHRPETTALTVGFEGARFDETPAARRTAVHLVMRHEVLRFGRQEFLDAFDRLAHGMDQPMADPATMATLLAFEHCRDRFDAVLDGTGADEAVGAMPPRHVRLAVEYGSRVPASLRVVLVRAMSHLPGLAGYIPILDFEHPAETLMRWKGFTRVEIEELCGEPVSLEDTTFYRTFARYPRHAHYERYSALLNAMPCDRLTQAMRLTGLRVRFPFCARDVDGFLRQLPTDYRHLPGQPKRILRELLARYVPCELWDGPKRGFTFPLHDFLAGDDFALVRQHVLAGRWLGRGLLRPNVVRRYAQAYIGGDQRLMFRVWALVVLGAWLDAHEDLTIPRPGA